MKNVDGNTPLHNACDNKNISLGALKHLTENKANVSAKNNSDLLPYDYLSKNTVFLKKNSKNNHLLVNQFLQSLISKD